ncbi:MAG: FAD binding domain-containing protein [Roseovarius sp.]
MQHITYTRAVTAEAAVAAFSEAGEGARYIAGGTTLYDLMKLGIERPKHLIDLSGIDGLQDIEEANGALRIGAMALMSDVARSVADTYPVLAESLEKAASQQLRNMATVGGNLLQRTRCPYFRAGSDLYPCNKLSPGSGCAAQEGHDRAQAVLGASAECNAVAPGDWPIALVALDARIELRGPDGSRGIGVPELYQLPGTTPEREFSLRPGEIVTAVVIPETAAARASTYHKIRDRESYAFALASAAVALAMEGDTIREARIAVGGVATRPWRAAEAEALLTGQPFTRSLAEQAGAAAFEGATPGRENAYKIDLGASVVADALEIAFERSRA